MSNAKRPNLVRQSAQAQKKRTEALDEGLTITVDGTAYTVVQGDLTSLDTMALRRETGYSFRRLLEAFRDDPDVDLIAALVWLSRRVQGERMLSFAEVADEIGYDVEIDIKTPDGSEEAPEA